MKTKTELIEEVLRLDGRCSGNGKQMKCLQCNRREARKKFCSDKCKGRFYAKNNREHLNAVKSAWIKNNPQYYKDYWRDYRKNKAVKNATSHTELEKIFMNGVKY